MGMSATNVPADRGDTNATILAPHYPGDTLNDTAY
jgi:hypothetical protein